MTESSVEQVTAPKVVQEATAPDLTFVDLKAAAELGRKFFGTKFPGFVVNGLNGSLKTLRDAFALAKDTATRTRNTEKVASFEEFLRSTVLMGNVVGNEGGPEIIQMVKDNKIAMVRGQNEQFIIDFMDAVLTGDQEETYILGSILIKKNLHEAMSAMSRNNGILAAIRQCMSQTSKQSLQNAGQALSILLEKEGALSWLKQTSPAMIICPATEINGAKDVMVISNSSNSDGGMYDGWSWNPRRVAMGGQKGNGGYRSSGISCHPTKQLLNFLFLDQIKYENIKGVKAATWDMEKRVHTEKKYYGTCLSDGSDTRFYRVNGDSMVTDSGGPSLAIIQQTKSGNNLSITSTILEIKAKA